jgi:hypothetical protein
VYSDVGGWKKEFGLYDNQEDAEAAIDAFWAAVCALEGGGAVGPVTRGQRHQKKGTTLTEMAQK